MKYSLQILKNKNLFKRHKYPFTNALNIKYFGNLSYNHCGALDITKLSNPSLQEDSMPKKLLDVALGMNIKQKVRIKIQQKNLDIFSNQILLELIGYLF